ncbi:MAG: hypothetical protein ABW217_15300, partial [Polyangiaceae bacterium]
TFLGLIQLSSILCARLVVQHAASRAARAAVVVLDDDPERYGGAARGSLVYDAAPEAAVPAADGAALARLLQVAPAPNVAGARGRGSARLSAIRWAAYMPLAVLAPSTSLLARRFGLAGSELGSDLGSGVRFVLGLLLYNRAAAIVTLRDAPGSGRVTTSAPSNGDVTVHVTYLYYCSMPFADRFLCDSLSGLPELLSAGSLAGDVAAQLEAGDFGAASEAMDPALRAAHRLGGAGELRSLADELRYAELPALLVPLALSGARFRVLHAEATLPNQGACYYRGSSCGREQRR